MVKKVTQTLLLINDFFKHHAIAILKVSATVGISCLFLLSIMLVFEYRFFKRETQKMLNAQDDYRNYVLAVKKILHDYNKTKARLEELETLVVEKKKEFEEFDIAGQTIFPEGVRVYSSDDSADDSNSFITINRELEYLKQSTLDYLKQQKLYYLEQRMGPEVWIDYTDQVLERNKVQAQKKHIKRRKKVSRNRRQRTYPQQTQQSTASKGKSRVDDINMIWPIDRSVFWLSSPFGARKKPNGTAGFHTGIDLAATKGTPVKSAAGGIVVEARYVSGYGNTVVVAHTGKYRTRYAHLNSMSVDVGQKVEQGQLVGKVGATGCVRSKRRGGDASHLHFEVHAFGKQVNPIYFLA
ncbi:MAG: M23 family metallopeptidase [Candidatus Babeliales bacterium]|nr:M23 family metallopeptidase [Candidatus Babeliales bacterium]